MHRSRRPSVIATILSGLLLIAQSTTIAAAPPGGSSKSVSVHAAGLTGLGSFTVSAGQSIPLSITVANGGKQSVNSVKLQVGQDGDPTTAANGDANPPIALPTGVTAAAAGCGPAGQVLVCDIGTLRAGRSVKFDVVVSVAEDAGALARFGTKATVTVAEGGSDNGSNLDTFSIEGDLSALAFSCESVSAYRPGSSARTVATCELGDPRNANKQRATVTLPAGLTTVTLKENAGAACPVVSGLTCIGDEVEADITGDDRDDTVRWVIEIQLDGAKVTLSRLVVYHYDDAGNLVEAIPLSKRNACKSAGAQGCGSAEIVNGVLIVTFQSQGNGRGKILG